MTAPDIDLVRLWVSQLPNHLLEQLTDALNAGATSVGLLRNGSHGPASKAIIESAYIAAKAGRGTYLAGLLTGYRAAIAEQPTVVPVWTGPDPGDSAGGRLTLAVVAGLVDEAVNEILLVSYATAPSPEVREALLRATARGVTVTALLERTTDPSQVHWPFKSIARDTAHSPALARHRSGARRIHARQDPRHRPSERTRRQRESDRLWCRAKP